MPIYAYRCDSCGFEKDHLQKLSDAVLRICPQCGQATYSKQLTAAGFQLKGTGWYATDFKAPSTTGKPESTDKPASTDANTDGKAGTESKASADATPASASGASACAGS